MQDPRPIHMAEKPASRTGGVAFPMKCLKSPNPYLSHRSNYPCKRFKKSRRPVQTDRPSVLPCLLFSYCTLIVNEEDAGAPGLVATSVPVPAAVRSDDGMATVT